MESKRLPLMSDERLNRRIANLNSWMEEGRKFPGNYANLETITSISASLIQDLVNERAILIKEINSKPKPPTE